MKVNSDKTVLALANKTNFFKYMYSTGGTSFSEITKYKYLCLTLENNLSWPNHISNICIFGFICRKLRHACPAVTVQIYNTVVHTKLKYASIIWD